MVPCGIQLSRFVCVYINVRISFQRKRDFMLYNGSSICGILVGAEVEEEEERNMYPYQSYVPTSILRVEVK